MVELASEVQNSEGCTTPPPVSSSPSRPPEWWRQVALPLYSVHHSAPPLKLQNSSPWHNDYRGTKGERKAQITQNATDIWILLYSGINHLWSVFIPCSFHDKSSTIVFTPCSFHALGLQLWQRASPHLWVQLRGSDIGSCRWRNTLGAFLRSIVAPSGPVCRVNGSAFLCQLFFSSRNPIPVLNLYICFSLRSRRMREHEGGGAAGAGV